MSDLATLIDRLRNDWLEPPDELWPRTALTADVADDATTLPIDLDLLTPEERHLIGLGMLAEVGSEEVMLRGLSGSDVTVKRAIRGSTAAAHSDGDEVLLKPPWTRRQMFNALREAIAACSPPLFSSTATTVTVGSGGITEIPAAVLSVSRLLSADGLNEWAWDDLGSWEGSTTGRAVRISGVDEGEEGVLSYRSRLLLAESEADTLADLGLAEEFAEVPILKAAAVLIGSRVLSARQQEFVTRQLAAESYPVDTPTRASQALLRLYAIRINEARTAIAARYPEHATAQMTF